MKPIGDYIKLPMDSWPVKGRTGFAGGKVVGSPVDCLFYAEPIESSEMVAFRSCKVYPWGDPDGRTLRRFGFAPVLGYFLEHDSGDTYHLEMAPAAIVSLKRRLYERWKLPWDPEAVMKREEEETGLKVDALSRFAEAAKGIEVPEYELTMEARDDGHIVYVIAGVKPDP